MYLISLKGKVMKKRYGILLVIGCLLCVAALVYWCGSLSKISTTGGDNNITIDDYEYLGHTDRGSSKSSRYTDYLTMTLTGEVFTGEITFLLYNERGEVACRKTYQAGEVIDDVLEAYDVGYSNTMEIVIAPETTGSYAWTITDYQYNYRRIIE